MQVILQSRSKAKAKAQRRDSAGSSTRTIFIGGKNSDRCWTRKIFALWLSSVEETDPSSSSRKSTSRQWWSDWILENKRSSSESFSCFVIIGLTKHGRTAWQEEEDKRKDFSIVLILQEQFCTLRALQGHSGRNLIHPSLQDKCHYSGRFLSSTFVMSDVQSILHSIINSGLIPGGQNLSNKTDSVLFTCRSYEQRTQGFWHDRLASTASCTTHAQSMEETSKHGVFGRHQPCSEERIEVLSDTIERHHSSRNTPSLLYPESCSDGKWRSHFRESICVTSASTKDFLETSLDEGIGFRSCSTTRRSCSTSKKFSTNPTKPNPNHDRTGRPVVCSERAPRSQEIETRSSREEDVNHDRRGDPLFAHKERLKHVFLVTARTLIWKKKQITNERRDTLFALNQSVQCYTRLTSTSEYLDCHILLWNKLRTIVFVSSLSRSRITLTDKDLQRDLQQNHAYIPFSEKSKKMIKDVGYVELFELFETDHKTQCKACLSY